jgi:4-hydroxy-tetrahydrodipicolinate reductase
MSTRMLLIGDGKMGRALAQIVVDRGGAVAAMYGPADMTRPIPAGIADVAIEFTQPSAAAGNVRAALAAGLPVVSGTTGWDAELAAVQDEVRRSGGTFLHAANFSLGVHLFRQLVATAARLAQGTEFDAHLVETHHAAKLDAPSGTARVLAAAAEEATGAPLPTTSVRVGHVPGTHTLVLDAPFEQITLTHEARDRRVFAAGAVAVATWLVGQRGVCTLDDYVSALTGAPR